MSAATGTVIGDMTLQGGNAAAFDGNTTQGYASGCARKNSSPAFLGKDWGGGNDKVLYRYKVYGTPDNGFANTGSFAIALQGSATGAWGGEEATLHSQSGISDSNGLVLDFDEDDGVDTSTAYRYHRVLLTTGGESYVAEVEFYEVVTGDMTLVSIAPTAAADPSTARITLDHEDVGGSAVLNTDVAGEASRDNGTTWTAGTLALLRDAGGGRKVYTADVDLSAQPSGTDLRWRGKQLNGTTGRWHRWAVQADVLLSV